MSINNIEEGNVSNNEKDVPVCHIIISIDNFKDREMGQKVYDIVLETARKGSNECGGNNSVEVVTGGNGPVLLSKEEYDAYWKLSDKERDEYFTSLFVDLHISHASDIILQSYVREEVAKAISLIADPNTSPTAQKTDVAKMLGVTAGGKKLLRLYRDGRNYLFFGVNKKGSTSVLVTILTNL